MPEADENTKQGLSQFFKGLVGKPYAPSIPLKPTTADPYDRGHYVYGEDGHPIGYTPEYAKVARNNYDHLQRAISNWDVPQWALGVPALKMTSPASWMLWGLDGMLTAQSKVPPPPGPARK